MNMNASINRDGCIGCGLCAGTCPEVFQMADDGLAEVYLDPVPDNLSDSALQAMNECPVSVITVE